MNTNLSPLLTYFWNDIILYIGYENGRGNRRHLNIPGCVFSLGLQGKFKVTQKNDSKATSTNSREFSKRSALFLPNTTWSDSYQSDCVVALIFGPTNPLKFALQNRMQSQKNDIPVDIHNETATINLFQNILDNCPDPNTTKTLIEKHFSVDCNYIEKNIDIRIRQVIQILNDSLSKRPDIHTLSQQVMLSNSRLMSLFKAETGVTMSRYILWRRFISTLISTTRGENSTTSAINYGFADGAQFSRTFNNLIGTSLTNILKHKDIIKAQYSYS